MSHSEFSPPSKKRRLEVSEVAVHLNNSNVCCPACYNAGSITWRNLSVPTPLIYEDVGSSILFSLLLDHEFNGDTLVFLKPRRRDGWVQPNPTQTALHYSAALRITSTYRHKTIGLAESDDPEPGFDISMENLRLCKIVHGSRMLQSLWDVS